MLCSGYIGNSKHMVKVMEIMLEIVTLLNY